MIPVNEPLLDGNEKKYLIECIDTGWISSEGPFVKQFEEKFASRMGKKHGIAVCNGTIAIDLAINVLDIQKGDEVIMPTFTIISCISEIVRKGAIPVLVDCDPDTWNMDVRSLEAKITSRTKAIMIVHIYGLPVDVNPVIELAKKYKIKIIEDAAEVHGQIYRGKPCGSFGDITVVSFYPNKHVVTGEGGMVLTDEDKVADKLRYYRNLCFEPKKRFVHEELGWNYRFTNIQAAVGLAQLERLDEFVIKKRWIGKLYNTLLGDLKDKIYLPLSHTEYAENIYWVYGILLKENVPFDAEELMKRLGAEQIGTRPFFWCMHEQPVLMRMGLFKNQAFPVAEKMSRRGLYLPSGLALKEEQIKKVSEVLHNLLK